MAEQRGRINIVRIFEEWHRKVYYDQRWLCKYSMILVPVKYMYVSAVWKYVFYYWFFIFSNWFEVFNNKRKEWRRVRNFVQFLHMSGFASQQWSIRHPNPMEPSILIATSSMEDGSAARAGPMAHIQLRNALYNRDLCRIISTFIPATFHVER